MAQIDVFKVAPREGDMLFHPFANIELTGYSRDQEGRILLSCDLMTASEVDYAVNGLIEQLEKARKKAKHHVETARGSLPLLSPR